MTDWAWVWGLVGVLGVIAGFLAFWRARSSDAAAKLSLKAAQESLTIAKRTEERETEVHFVDWEGFWSGPGTFALFNTGDDNANGVKLVLYIDYEPYNEYVDIVYGGDIAEFEIPKALQLWELGRDDLAARMWSRAQERIDVFARRQAAKSSDKPFGNWGLLAGLGMESRHQTEAMFDGAIGDHHVYYRVFWRTDLGTPKDSGYKKNGKQRLGPDYEDAQEDGARPVCPDQDQEGTPDIRG